ncbi:MAG: sensor histidine kinase [Cyclobacteriaceae bacterium]
MTLDRAIGWCGTLKASLLMVGFAIFYVIAIPAQAQEKQSIQVKTFDQKLQPLKNIELSVNGKGFISVGSKGIVFIEFTTSELPIHTIKIKDDQLEPASWNFTKGVLEIIVRKKNYQLAHLSLKLPNGRPISQAQISFKGKKSVAVITDAEGKFEVPLAMDEKIASANQFEIKDYQVVRFSSQDNLLVADLPKLKEEKQEEKKTEPIAALKPTSEIFQDFDLEKLDSIQSITVFYAVFKNIAIQELNPNARLKIDAKFNQLVAKMQDSVRLRGNGFINSISDSSFVRDDIRNLLNQATIENKILQADRSDFDSKIKIVTTKLEKGIVNLDATERKKLLSDLTLLENLLIENESRFYKNQNDYKSIINGLKEKYFDMRNLENKLSETEAKRAEEQQTFRQRLIAISGLVVLFGILIVMLISVRGKLRKQKAALLQANDEVKRINENLEGIVQHRTKLLIDANQELDTFLYRASHDLRSPLSSIIGLCNISSYLTRDELVEKVKLTTHGMDRLLSKLKMISEINRPTDYSSFSLLNAIERVKYRFKMEIENNQIQFRINCPENIVFYTYPDLIEIILSNLIENALFYSKMGDHPIALVEFRANVKADQVEFSVYDNGVGVDNAIRPKLFDMFFKGNEKSLGNGLGLYVVQKSVQTLRGKITMESEQGSYTKFIVQLPLNHKKATAQELAEVVS